MDSYFYDKSAYKPWCPSVVKLNYPIKIKIPKLRGSRGPPNTANKRYMKCNMTKYTRGFDSFLIDLFEQIFVADTLI